MTIQPLTNPDQLVERARARYNDCRARRDANPTPENEKETQQAADYYISLARRQQQDLNQT